MGVTDRKETFQMLVSSTFCSLRYLTAAGWCIRQEAGSPSDVAILTQASGLGTRGPWTRPVLELSAFGLSPLDLEDLEVVTRAASSFLWQFIAYSVIVFLFPIALCSWLFLDCSGLL